MITNAEWSIRKKNIYTAIFNFFIQNIALLEDLKKEVNIDIFYLKLEQIVYDYLVQNTDFLLNLSENQKELVKKFIIAIFIITGQNPPHSNEIAKKTNLLNDHIKEISKFFNITLPKGWKGRTVFKLINEELLKKKISQIVSYLPIQDDFKNKTVEDAQKLYYYAKDFKNLENQTKNLNKLDRYHLLKENFLSIILVYYSLVGSGIQHINNERLSGKLICKLVDKDSKICSEIRPSLYSSFLPDNPVYKSFIPRRYEYTYDEIKLAVESRGGTLITSPDEFSQLIKHISPSKVELLISCNISEHPPFMTNMKKIQKSRWCPKCGGTSPLTYEDFVNLAKIRGIEGNGMPGHIKILKDEFILLKNRAKTHINWECANGHIWKSTYDSISHGSWCPICSESRSEKICRWFFKQIFQQNFPRVRLSRIIKTYQGKMHFDGYSEILFKGFRILLAFEYNGMQHYVFPNYYHKNYTEFLEQIERDKEKIRLAEENNIILIVIDYTIEYDEMQNYILGEFKKKTGIKIENIPYFDYRKRFLPYYLDLDDFL